MDAIVLNVEHPSARLLERYRAERAFPVVVDEPRLRRLGVRVVKARVLATRKDFIRHDPARMAREVMRLAII